jgi:hypothetical protein
MLTSFFRDSPIAAERKTLVPEHTETRAHAAAAALALASAGLIPSPGAGFFGYEVVLR